MASPTKLNLYLVPEGTDAADFGVMPTSPAMQAVRTLADYTPFKYERETIKSNEKFSDRRPGIIRPGVKKVTNDLSLELTYGGICQSLIEAAMCGTFTAIGAKTATTLSVVASTRTIHDSAAGFDLTIFRPGAKVTITGFTTAGNNVTAAEVLTATAGDITFTTATTTLVDEDAGDSVTMTVAGTRCKSGEVRRAFAGIEDQTDVTNRYEQFLGIQAKTMTLESKPNAPITLKIGVVGIDHVAPSASAPSGATWGTPTITEAMNSIESDVVINGTVSGSNTSITFSNDNGIDVDPVNGSLVAYKAGGVGSTRIANLDPSIAFECILDDSSGQYATAMDAGTTIPFMFKTFDPAGNCYWITAPTCKIQDATKSGTGTDMMKVTGTAKPERSTAYGCVWFIDAIPA